MEEHFLKLQAANKYSDIDFLEVSKEQVEGVGIFEYGATHTNASDSFKRAKKRMEILEIHPNYLIIRITSETPLQMISKSLSGFSRELIRVGNQKKPGMFEDAVYNGSLFRSRVIENLEEILTENPAELSNTAALKMCIDLFYGETTKTKMQHETRQNAIYEIKKILLAYKREMEE